MTRYFFDIDNGDGFIPDQMGKNLDRNVEITDEIAQIVTDISNDEINGRDDFRVKVSVRDEAGNPIAVSTMTFATEWLKKES
ncbi:hypothetical protein LJR098_002380 [Rhizobium sp. LjRoot98]|uniref:DUF6894 family protein n=1 Tax=unclassified Rhizobium TaxID=2613769 RepID=UPI00071603AE|nr:hypothetical protein [Rhizobium sp. Root1204]KQV36414.1 hypothetical protein ASC96_27865 [Rhizobium sp. Root1204]